MDEIIKQVEALKLRESGSAVIDEVMCQAVDKCLALLRAHKPGVDEQKPESVIPTSSVARQLREIRADIYDFMLKNPNRKHEPKPNPAIPVLGKAKERLTEIIAAIESIEARQGVDEEMIGHLANVLIETVERHLRSGQVPLRTAICQQLRNASPWLQPQHPITEDEAVEIMARTICISNGGDPDRIEVHNSNGPNTLLWHYYLRNAVDVYRALSSQAHITRKEPNHA